MHVYPTVNVDEVVAVRDMILTQMNGTTPAEYTFQKKNQVVTLSLKSSSVNSSILMEIEFRLIHCSSFRDLLLSCNHQMIWS